MKTSTSLAFFLASFQVHEKGILIALAPLSLLAADAPNFVSWFSIAATWTLWPLLTIDRLCEAYVCCLVIYLCINSMVGLPSSKSNPNNADVDIFLHRHFTRFIPPLSFAVMILLHMSEWVVAPPSHLPDLFPVLWSLMGCGIFCISFAATLWAMFVQVAKGNTKQKATGNTKRNTRAKSTMQKKVYSLTMGIACLCGATFGEAFLFSPLSHPTHLNQWTMSTAKPSFVFSPQKNNMLSFLALHSSDKNFDIGAILTSDLLARARVPLAWEVQQARDSKPVLNLSVRDPGTLSLSDEAMSATGDDFDDASMMDDKDGSWEDGHLWVDTERQLMSIGILLDSKDTKSGDENKLASKLTSESILSRAPQLLRLPSLQIIDSAHFFLSGGNATTDAMDSGSICSSTAPSKPKWSLALLLQVDPSLLTYRADDLYHGLEYLTNMMARGNRAVIIQSIQSQYFLSPLMATQLFRMGVDSGMDERRVSLALGNAAKASGKAVQGIVGDLGKDIRELKRIKGGKGSL